MKKTSTLLLATCFAASAFAGDPLPMNTEFQEGYYKYMVFTNNDVKVSYDVTYMGPGSCTDDEIPSPEEMTIPSAVTYEDYTYPVSTLDQQGFYHLAVKTLNLPSSLKWIRSSSVEGCLHLASIYIPENVNRIDNNAFGRCTSLRTVTIPYNVTKISGDAFSGCSAMETLVMLGELGNGFNGGFTGLPEGCVLYTPSDAYDLATGWSGAKEKLGPYVEQESLNATQTSLKFMLEDNNTLDAFVDKVIVNGTVVTPDNDGYYTYAPASAVQSYTLNLECQVNGNFYKDSLSIPAASSAVESVDLNANGETEWINLNGARTSEMKGILIDPRTGRKVIK